jgi:CheY-like chemotaxis protein
MSPRPVLVVDDDPDMLHMTETVLTYAGIPTVSASNGLEALERAKTTKPGLILLDLMMPVMDGYQFRRHQLEDPVLRKIPVVCVTAVPPGANEATQLRVNACVHKPVDWEELLEAVHKFRI